MQQYTDSTSTHPAKRRHTQTGKPQSKKTKTKSARKKKASSSKNTRSVKKTAARSSQICSHKKKRPKKRKLHFKRLAGAVVCSLVLISLITNGCSRLIHSIWVPEETVIDNSEVLAQEKSEEEIQAQQIAFFQETLHGKLSTVQIPDGMDRDVYASMMKLAMQAESEEDVNYQIFMNLDSYSQEVIEFYLKDDDRADFVMQYPNRYSYSTAVSYLSENLGSVPHLLQWDLRWGYSAYGDSTVWEAGCAPTSLAMIYSYLLQDNSITPSVLAEYAYYNGYYVSGAGTSHSLMTDIAYLYPQVQAVQVSADSSTILSLLDEGYLLIFNVGPGDFTTTGHFIVVDGAINGYLQVKDPNSIKKTRDLWDVSQVLEQTKAVFAYKLDI